MPKPGDKAAPDAPVAILWSETVVMLLARLEILTVVIGMGRPSTSRRWSARAGGLADRNLTALKRAGQDLALRPRP